MPHVKICQGQRQSLRSRSPGRQACRGRPSGRQPASLPICLQPVETFAMKLWVALGSRIVVNIRMFLLAALVVLATGCASSTPGTAPTSPAATPTSPTPSQSITPPSAAALPLACHARASSRRPREHTTVRIEVQTKGRARVTATDVRSLPGGQSRSGRASATGELTLRFGVGVARPGSRVIVDVRVFLNGRRGHCRTSFRPRSSLATTRSPTPAPPPSCYPLTNGGNCYESGEYCRDSDHGASGVAGNGERIICEDNNGWRWEPA